MSKRKPDLFWVLALVVAMGAASSALTGGEEEPRMAPQQAGIIIR